MTGQATAFSIGSVRGFLVLLLLAARSVLGGETPAASSGVDLSDYVVGQGRDLEGSFTIARLWDREPGAMQNVAKWAGSHTGLKVKVRRLQPEDPAILAVPMLVVGQIKWSEKAKENIREYLTERNGFLFLDACHGKFREAIDAVLPGAELVDISSPGENPILATPFPLARIFPSHNDASPSLRGVYLGGQLRVLLSHQDTCDDLEHWVGPDCDKAKFAVNLLAYVADCGMVKRLPRRPLHIEGELSEGTLRLKVTAARLLEETEGRLSLSLRDLRDRELGRHEGTLDLTPGEAALNVELPTKRVRDLYETRLVATYSQPNWQAKRVFLLADLIGAADVRISAQRKLLAGGTGALRISVVNHKTGRPIPGAHVKLTVDEAGGDRKPLRGIARLEGTTDAAGTMEASFPVPVDCAPQLAVTVEARTPHNATDTVSASLTVERRHRILLSTDKPFYRPGDAVHVRAVVLGQGDLKPEAGLPVSFEIREPQGNTVFRENAKLSPFGVASARFQLAKELRTGTYALAARADGGTPERRDLVVKEYVLPKFKVAVDLDRKLYAPGDAIRGSVRATYFFGKPVSGGEVEILGITRAFRAKGKTDAEGRFAFEVPSQGGRPGHFSVEVKVTDGAGHLEHGYADAQIAESPLTVNAFPEAGHLVPGVANRIYVRCATVLDEPVEGATIIVRSGEETLAEVTSDSQGLAVFELASPGERQKVAIEAKDRQGRSCLKTVELKAGAQSGRMLVRPSSAWPKVGDELRFELLAPGGDGQACLDLFRTGHLVRTLSAPLDEDGRGQATVALTEDLAGMLAYRGYRAGFSPEAKAEARPLLVRPSKSLSIEVTKDAPEHVPGAEAKLRFRVRDEEGEGKFAQIGVAAVDESIFALSDVKPGVERYYFLTGGQQGYAGWNGTRAKTGLEQMLARPVSDADAEKRARFLLASLPPVSVEYPVRASSEPAKRARYIAKLPPMLAEHLFVISDTDRTYFRDKTVRDLRRFKTLSEYLGHLLEEKLLRPREIVDPWGTPYRFALIGGIKFGIASAGPDLVWKTGDDLVAWREFEAGPSVRPNGPGMLAEPEPAARLSGILWKGAGKNAVPYRALTDDIDLAKAIRSEGLKQFLLALWPVDERALSEGEDAISDIPLGGTGVIGCIGVVGYIGVGGGGAGCFGYRHGGGRKKSVARFGGSAAGESAPRIRRFFPETLYVNPGIITDLLGCAEITMPLADSITDWRLTAYASDMEGRLGSALGGIRVFQPFFIDLDLPAFLTRRDEVSVPVAIHNYLPRPQRVRLSAELDPGLELLSARSLEKLVPARDVTSAEFRIRARKVGLHRVKVTAVAEQAADAVERKIDVRPDGQIVEVAQSAILRSSATTVADIPPLALPDSVAVYLRLYPGVLSQTVEGLEKMLRKPYGCFEQTWSTTYPNLLVLDYLEKAGTTDVELIERARELVNEGYQRLLQYEVSGGGFSLFGRPPADELLTAYGLNGFSDMARVHPAVDSRLIARTRSWLLSRQSPDGSWTAGRPICHAPAWRGSKTATVLATAYVAAAIARSGKDDKTDKAVEKALAYLDGVLDDVDDPYALGVVAGAYLAADRHDSAKALVPRLVSSAATDKGKAHWRPTIPTWTGARNDIGAIETTGEVARLLAELGAEPVLADGALGWLVEKKRPGGGWGSTQATILALKALLANARGSARSATSVVRIRAGAWSEEVSIDSGASGELQQVDLTRQMRKGRNLVRLEVPDEQGGVTYQLVTRYALPWRFARLPRKGLELHVDFDRRRLRPDEQVDCRVALVNRLSEEASAPMIELGVPPGFSPDVEALEELVSKKSIERFDSSTDRVILYLESLASGARFELACSFTARFSGRVSAPASSAYLYYNPDVRALARPTPLVVAR